MANQYDTNLKLQAIADAIGNTSSSGLISALEDIADAVAGGGGGGSSTAGLVSDNFSETDTYDLGDYCIHNNTLYVCINAITTPGTWDLSDWQATNAGLELSSLNSAIVNVSGRLTQTDAKVLGIESSLVNGTYANTGYASFNVDINNAWGSWYQSSVISINLGGDFRNKRVEYSVISDNYSFVPSAVVTSTGIEITLFRPTSATGVTGKVYVRAFN